MGAILSKELLEQLHAWNILGNTPINLFDKSKDIPCFAKPGDRVKFFQISELINGS